MGDDKILLSIVFIFLLIGVGGFFLGRQSKVNIGLYQDCDIVHEYGEFEGYRFRVCINKIGELNVY